MSNILNRESVNDTAKLIMHRLIARELLRDPSLVERARAVLEKTAVRFPTARSSEIGNSCCSGQ